jgi:hypothetical protein
MQHSASVFHGVREAKVTTNWRGTESACTYQFDPLRTLERCILLSNCEHAIDFILNPARARRLC